MNKNLLIKFISAVAIVSMMMSYINVITNGVYAAYEELEKQGVVSNNKNVEFDAYFKQNNNKTHNLEADIYSGTNLYLSINVKNAGYLRDATIALDNPNYKISEDFKGNEFVQSIDYDKNQIVVKQITNGQNTEIEVPIKFVKSDSVNLDYFAKETKANISGTYLDQNGKEKNINSEIKTRLSWNTNPVAEVSQNVLKFGEYQTTEGNGTYIQTLVNSGLQNNSLPIDSTNLKITVPQYANKVPDSIKVYAKTIATNGNEDGTLFNTSNWSYNKESGLLEINVNNAKNNNQVNWKNGKDEYYITYLYSDVKANVNTVKLNMENNITPYINTNTVKGVENKDVVLPDPTPNIVSVNVSSTPEIAKGYLYANNKYETAYNVTAKANVSFADGVDKILLNVANPKFVNKDGSKFNANSNIYYKDITIEKAVFDKVLGSEGNIQIYDQNNNNILGIDKNTAVDNNGNIVVAFKGQDVNALKIETSKPVIESEISFGLNAAIKQTTDLSRSAIMNLATLDTEVASQNDKQTASTNMKETTTKAEMYINTTSLTTTNKNENVELKAVLLSNDNNYDLYQNPVVTITLPQEVQDVTLKTINLLYDDNMKIANYNVATNESGNKVIKVALQGTQTDFVTDISKGINLVINTDITLNKTAASRNAEVGLSVSNEKAVSYDNKGYWSTPVNIYAPQGVVLLSSVTNFNANGSEVTSLANKEQVGKLETKSDAKNVTIKSTVVNNNGKDITNTKILGKIPFKGNTKTTGEDLNTTIDSNMTSGVKVSGVDGAKIYYTENSNPSTDLNNESNGWTTNPDLTKVKSYMVDLGGTVVPQGSSFDLNYTAQIPANLDHNENAYSTYTAYYDEPTDNNQLVNQSEVAPTTGVSTGKGPVLDTTITSNMPDKFTTIDNVKFTVTTKNTGEVDAQNAKVVINLPENVYYAKEVALGNGGKDYQKDESMRTIEISLGNIAVGETKEASFVITTDKEGKLKLTANISADNMEKQTTVESSEYTVEKSFFLINFTSSTENNVSVGSEISYMLIVTNATNDKIKNVKATIPLNDNVEFVDAYAENYDIDPNKENTDSSVAKYDKKKNVVTYDVGDLEGRAAAPAKYILKVKSKQPNTVKLMASVVGNSTAEQNSQETVTDVTEPKLNVDASVNSTQDIVKMGDELIYTVKVNNPTSGVIKNVKVQVAIPENLKYLNTTYYREGTTENNGKFDGYLFDNGVSSVTLDINAGETLIFQVKVSANKMIDMSKSEEESIVKVTVSADGVNPIEKTIGNRVQNNGNGSTNSGSQNGTYSILGTAWLDENRNGIRDSGEKLLSGIPVMVISADSGSAVKNSSGDEITATTGSDGTYELKDLVPGKYIVQFKYDNNKYAMTEYKKQGSDEKTNSDAINTTENNGTAITDNLTLSNQSLANIDLGLVTKGTFNLQLNKTITRIGQSDGKKNKVTNFDNKKIAKVDVDGKRTGETVIAVDYTITITNKGNVAGYAKKIVDQIPEELSFTSSQNKDWYSTGSGVETTALENEIINPGESKSIVLRLTKKTTTGYTGGTVTNKAQISETYNDQGVADTKDSDDEAKSTANLILGIKTGGAVLYIGLTIGIMAVIALGAYIINKKVIK